MFGTAFEHIFERIFDCLLYTSTIEARIEQADTRLRAAQQRTESPEVVTDPAALTAALADLEQATADHHAVYKRWVELTEKITG